MKKRKAMDVDRRAWLAAERILSGTDNATELRKSWYRSGYRMGVRAEQRRARSQSK